MTMPAETHVPYRLTRMGVVMTPAGGDPNEAEGVLNPASGRGPDGELYVIEQDGDVNRLVQG